MTLDFSDNTGLKQQTGRTSRQQSHASFAIEQGIPVPPVKRRGPNPVLDAMEKCEPGDSFFVPVESTASRNSTMMAISRSKSLVSGKFTTRASDEGIRVWRIAE